MKKQPIMLFVALIICSLVTPLTYAMLRVVEGTIVSIEPQKDYPITIAYTRSNGRTYEREAMLCEALGIDDVNVGMTINWKGIEGGRAIIVGPIPENSSDEPDQEPVSPPPSTRDINKVVIMVENSDGESLTFELDDGDWHMGDENLFIDSFVNVSSLVGARVHGKTVMFVTHIPWDQHSQQPFQDESKFNVWKWNYIFPDFSTWGDYFNYQTPDQDINARLEEFKALGLRNILYVDATESHRSISDRWSDSILESGDWWSLMTLDPSKSWYRYLKEGMLGLTERFPTIDGFAIDRLDRCANGQEEAWAAQLLDEVRREAGIPVRYVMNSLQPWMTDLASRASFIGSDGVDTGEASLGRALRDYGRLAEVTELGVFYINPYMGMSDGELVRGYRDILAVHDFVFVDDYYVRLLSDVFPG